MFFAFATSHADYCHALQLRSSVSISPLRATPQLACHYADYYCHYAATPFSSLLLLVISPDFFRLRRYAVDVFSPLAYFLHII